MPSKQVRSIPNMSPNLQTLKTKQKPDFSERCDTNLSTEKTEAKGLQVPKLCETLPTNKNPKYTISESVKLTAFL